MKNGYFSLPFVTLKAMWRRKFGNLAIVLMLILGVASAAILQQLTLNQEKAKAQMIKTTDIRCVVTDANGMNADNIYMLSDFVEKLLGNDPDCDINEYVDNVYALSCVPVKFPEDYELRRILNFASDEDLSEFSGVKINLYEGYGEEIFLTDERVCIVSSSAVSSFGESLTVEQEGQEPMELKIIGTFEGGIEKAIYCPFHVKFPGSVHQVFSVKSCSFSIRDNEKLEESKAVIYETFCEPSVSAINDGMTFGVLIQDKVYSETLEQIEENLTLLSFLLPILSVLCFLIGGITSYLSTKGRIYEFAVMRCLGVPPIKVFLLVFEEFLVLAILGGTLGFLTGYSVQGTLSQKAMICAFGIIGVYLLGAAAAVIRICNVNVMKLMKGADEE